MFSPPDGTTIPFLILFFTIAPIPNGAAAQSSTGMNADPSFSLCMAVIVVFMGLFIASFSIYIRYCSSRPSSAHSGFLSAAQANKATGGLDQWTIETFPTFTYAEVKDHRLVKGDLECAVCLTEFEDTELLRLIPKCDHVFHPECIDAWLESHVTCPVCRAILDMDSVIDEVHADATVVQVVCENPPVQEPNRHGLEQNRLPRNGSHKRSRCVLGLGGFRSNSTGHSVLNVECVDVEGVDVEGVDVEDVHGNRFTLNLTEEKREEIVQRAITLHRAKSCSARSGSTTKDPKTESGSTTKEPKTGSGRREKSYRRMASLDLARASPVFSRTPSMISRDNNCEGSSSQVLKPTFMVPSTKCIDKKPTNEISHVMVDPV